MQLHRQPTGERRLGVGELHELRLLWLSLWEGGVPGEYISYSASHTKIVYVKASKDRLRLASTFIYCWSNFIITKSLSRFPSHIAS